MAMINMTVLLLVAAFAPSVFSPHRPPGRRDLAAPQSDPIRTEVVWSGHTFLLPLSASWHPGALKISLRSGQLNTNKTIIYEAGPLIDSSLKA